MPERVSFWGCGSYDLSPGLSPPSSKVYLLLRKTTLPTTLSTLPIPAIFAQAKYTAPAGFELPPKIPLYFATNCHKQ